MAEGLCTCCTVNPVATMWDGREWVPVPTGLCKGCIRDPNCKQRKGHP